MAATLIGVAVAIACFSVTFFASRMAATARSEWSDSSFRTLTYLLAGGFSYVYPVGDDPVRWMLFVLTLAVGLGYFSRKFRDPSDPDEAATP